GDYAGTHYLDFPNIALRNVSYTRSFTLTNSSSRSVTLNLSSDQLTSVGTQDLTIYTAISKESDYAFRSPDYLVTPAQLQIPAGTDLMQVQLSHNFEKFCTEDPTSTMPGCGERGQNAWYLRAYAWTDWNKNGKVWTDTNTNGAVNDGELDLPGTAPLDTEAS